MIFHCLDSLEIESYAEITSFERAQSIYFKNQNICTFEPNSSKISDLKLLYLTKINF